jgi:hypothetical protein
MANEIPTIKLNNGVDRRLPDHGDPEMVKWLNSRKGD